MRTVYADLLGLSILLGAGFIVAYGPPSRTENPRMAWLQAALAGVAVAFDIVFLLAVESVIPPAWIIFVILAAQDAVFGWRLVALFRARQKGRQP